MSSAIVTIYYLHVIQAKTESEKMSDLYFESHVSFSVEYEHKVYGGKIAVVNQPFGTAYQNEPFEVKPLKNLDLPFNLHHEQLTDAIEDYVKSLIGTRGNSINYKHVKNVEIENSIFSREQSYRIDIVDESGGW